MRKSIVALSILVLCVGAMLSANTSLSHQFPVEHYSVFHGLPQSDITKVFLSNKGILWIGTSDGLSRYDGYSFDNFLAYRKQSQGLLNDYIIDIDEDNNNEIWILTRNGLEHRNSKQQVFEHFPISLPGGIPTDFFYDKRNQRIFITNGYSLAYLETFDLPNALPKYINSLNLDNRLGFFYIDPVVWISNGHILYYYSSQEPVFNKLSELPHVVLPSVIRSVHQYDSAHLMVQTDKALILFDYSQNTLSELIKLDQIVSSDEEFLPKIKIDDKGCVILAQKSGLYRYDPLQRKTEIIYQTDERLMYPITDFDIDKSGIFWIGTANGFKRVMPRKQGFWVYAEDNFDYTTNLIPDLKNRQFLFKHNGMGFTYTLYPKNQILDEPFVCDQTPEVLCHSVDNEYFFVGTTQGVFQKSDDLFLPVKQDHPKQKITRIQNYSDTLLLSASDSLLIIMVKDSNQRNVYHITKRVFDSTRIVDFTFERTAAFIATEFGVYQYFLEKDSIQTIRQFTDRKPGFKINDLYITSNEQLWIATNDGIFYYDIEKGAVIELPILLQYNDLVSLIEDSKLRLWAASTKGVLKINLDTKTVYYFTKTDGITDADFIAGAALYADNRITFGGENSFLSFYPDSIYINWHRPQTVFTFATIQKGNQPVDIELYNRDTLSIYRSTKYAKISFSALDYYAPFNNSYQYSLVPENKRENWQQLGTQNSILLAKLQAGTYHLKVRAFNSHGVPAYDYARLVLDVDTQIWESKLAIALYGILVIAFIYLLIFLRTQHLQRVNQEYKEKERIARKIQIQKEELSLKNKNITDSINYARRIQMAMMPSERFFKSYFPDSFILYVPKDIVSGDFYWINEVNDQVYFSAVDCTGHGVPGAFMSIIGFELFRRITEKEGTQTPGVILNQLSFDLQSLFADEEQLHDGMDLALCSIDKEYNTLQFSGAFNPLYLVRDNSIQEFKGDRFSVGWNGDDDGETNEFTNHTVELRDGDVLYIFTDGFADQFGGPEGKKYKYRRFRHLLLALHQLSMERQREFLYKSIMEWKGDLDQVDDILVIGIRINRQMLLK